MTITRRTLLSTSAATLLLGRAQSQAPATSGGAPAALGTSRRPAPAANDLPDTEWRHYAADQANTRYSPLAQITPDNFNQLEVAWRFKTDALGSRREFQFEATPLLIKGRLFLTAGARRDCIALDSETGELLWMHRIDEGRRGQNAPRQLSGHGVSYWSDGTSERVLYVTPGYQLICLDAATGYPDPAFGTNGVVDLKQNIDQPNLDLDTAEIGLHATPMVIKDVVVVGAAHMSGDVPQTRHNVKGYVRGFDVKTGKRLWIFHTLPRKGEYGYDTWLSDPEETGNGGVWAQMSADEELGLVYLPVELASGDEMGMYRKGNALYGESLVAVDYRTGERRWHYQFVHHGLWDRDVPCAPILCDIPVGGKTVKALAQPTKQAFVYVLDRTNGKPIWPIVERKVEKGDVPGEWYAPTQPIPSKPPAYDVQSVNADTVIDFTPELHAEALELLKHYKTSTLYTPPTMSTPDRWGTLSLPGFQGGTNWPGGCYDPETHMVYVYSKTQISVGGIIKNTNPEASDFEYVHGMTGVMPRGQVAMGAARPPGAFGGGEGQTPGPAPRAAPPGNPAGPNPPQSASTAGAGPRVGTVTVQGLPLQKPPYGRITAISLEKGDISWQIAHGETPDNIRNHPLLKGLKIPRTGRDGNLGPLCTKTLVICGESGFYTDPTYGRGAMLRAYDKATGVEKGQVFMPAPQSGSPMTYMKSGRQYIVVAIGGGNYSGELLAFRLPRGA